MGPTASLHLDSGREFRGAQRRVLYLVQGLAQRGHQAVLCCPRTSPLFARAEAAGLACSALTLRSGLDFPSAVRLARLVRDAPVDLVHAHDPQSHSIARAAQGISHERSLQANLFVTHHDVNDDHGGPGRLQHAGVHHIASSRQIRDALVRRGVDAARIAVVPDGVDLGSVERTGSANARDPWEFHARGLQVVGTVGDLIRERNQTVLLQAFVLLRAQNPDIHLLVVGDGPMRGVLEKRARNLGVADAVTFAGRMEDAGAAYASMRVFVLSSDVEDPCSPVLDAMAAGAPVVTTAAAGVLGVARHGSSALVVPPRDPPALAHAITLVLGQPDLAARLVQGGRDMAAQHSVDHMVEATLAAYRGLGQFNDAADPQRP